MRQIADNKPRARDDVIVERLPGETLVYDESRDTAHCLDEAAAVVFELCDGSRTRPAVAALAAQRLGRAFGEEEVDAVLEQLGTKSLLAGEDPAKGISRRQAVLAGGGVVAASLITSIVAPLPVAAQSPSPAPDNPGGPGTACQTQPDCDENLNCEGGTCCSPQFGPCTMDADCCGNGDCITGPDSPNGACIID